METSDMDRKRLWPLCRQIINVMENGDEHTIAKLCKILDRRQARIQNAVNFLEDIGVLSGRLVYVSHKDVPGRAPKHYKLIKNKIPQWYKTKELDYKEEKLRSRIINDITNYKNYMSKVMKNKGKQGAFSEEEHHNLKRFEQTGWSSNDPEKFTRQQLEFAISEAFPNKNPRRFIILPIPLQRGLENYQNAQMIEEYRGIVNSIINNIAKTKNKNPHQEQLEEELTNSLEFISKDEKEAILNQK